MLFSQKSKNSEKPIKSSKKSTSKSDKTESGKKKKSSSKKVSRVLCRQSHHPVFCTNNAFGV